MVASLLASKWALLEAGTRQVDTFARGIDEGCSLNVLLLQLIEDILQSIFAAAWCTNPGAATDDNKVVAFAGLLLQQSYHLPLQAT